VVTLQLTLKIEKESIDYLCGVMAKVIVTVNKSRGLGDTIAKFTQKTGIDKMAKKMAQAAGYEDCGCDARRDTLNRVFPYSK